MGEMVLDEWPQGKRFPAPFAQFPPGGEIRLDTGGHGGGVRSCGRRARDSRQIAFRWGRRFLEINRRTGNLALVRVSASQDDCGDFERRPECAQREREELLWMGDSYLAACFY
jgi:hypothetical protein